MKDAVYCQCWQLLKRWMECLPKSVGKKPGNPKRKGPAQKRPEIESVIDPHQQTGTPISSSLAMSKIHLATAQY